MLINNSDCLTFEKQQLNYNGLATLLEGAGCFFSKFSSANQNQLLFSLFQIFPKKTTLKFEITNKKNQILYTKIVYENDQ